MTVTSSPTPSGGAELGCSFRRCVTSARYSLTRFWIRGDRKLPWMVETPRGGCAGIRSIPTTMPLGFVRSTATWAGGAQLAIIERVKQRKDIRGFLPIQSRPFLLGIMFTHL